MNILKRPLEFAGRPLRPFPYCHDPEVFLSEENFTAFELDAEPHDCVAQELPDDMIISSEILGHDETRFHSQLAAFNASRLTPAKPHAGWQQALRRELEFRSAEGAFIEGLRAAVHGWMPDELPDVNAFMKWFEALAENGPGQGHALFGWLANEASMEQMRWFLRQEAAGEAGFEDLLAYTQVKLPVRPKLEFARNYWDEMGHGKARAMHGEMLGAMVRELDLRPEIDSTVCESLALANTMLAFATSRRYAFHSVGALGVIELTAPGRVKLVSDGMKRLGLNGRMRAYFDLHSVLDVHHSRAWNDEVIRPLLESDWGCARYIAEGALIRLLCGQRCFDRYSQVLMPAQAA